MSAWDEDNRVERLKVMWADGLSASQIAARLGGVTRNAVIGKRIRMGLPDRAPRRSNGMTKAARERERQRKPKRGHLQYGSPAAQLALEPFRPAPPIAVPPTQRKTILVHKDGKLHANETLTSACCRFPYGEGTKDDPFYFCGGPALEGLPYCAAHAAVAFQPPQPRRRRPDQAAPARATQDAEAA